MFIFDPCPVPTLPIFQEEKLFPVHRVYCVGQNYSAHALEMGTDPSKESPVFFLKPNDAIVIADGHNCIQHVYPSQTENYQPEVELVVAIGKEGKDISIEDAVHYIYGYALGLDMTKRDIQLASKSRKGPWETAKAFEESILINKIYPKELTGEILQGNITLSINGKIKQSANISELIWSVPNIICYLSRFFTLRAGDLIFTGTPAGVSLVKKGDIIEAGIQDLDTLMVHIL